MTTGQYTDAKQATNDNTHNQFDFTKSGGAGDITLSYSNHNITDSKPLWFIAWSKDFQFYSSTNLTRAN